MDNLLPRDIGEKLKSRIHQLEEQLESVTGASIQNDASKQRASQDDPTLALFEIPGVSPILSFETVSDKLGPSSSDIDIVFASNHASRFSPGSDTMVESNINATQRTSTVAQPDLLSRPPVHTQPTDLDWLLTDFGPLKHVPPPFLEGYENRDHNHGPPTTSLSRSLRPSDHVPIGRNRSQSIHKITTSPKVQNTGQNSLLSSNGTKLERLNLLVECSRRLGFSNLDEALSLYYTSDLSKSAMMSHERSLDRVRQLPSFLSSIREHSKDWPSWERTSYVRETLRSAEDIYAEECRSARMNLQGQGITGMTQHKFQFDQMFQNTNILQQEVRSASRASTYNQC